MAWIPTIIAIMTGIGSALSPQIQAFSSHNPELVGTIVAVGGALLHWLPSPIAKS